MPAQLEKQNVIISTQLARANALRHFFKFSFQKVESLQDMEGLQTLDFYYL